MRQTLIKTFSIILVLIASNNANGQTKKIANASKSVRYAKLWRPNFNHNLSSEYPIFPFAPVNPIINAKSNRNLPGETIIGASYYDLQTNNSIATRILNNSDGTLSATWTTSNEDNTSWGNRGMAYHQRVNGVWTKLPGYANVENVERIEPVRTGFGSIGRVNGVGDIIIAHQTELDALEISRNVDLNGENWIFQEDTAQPFLWPRLAIGGQDGKTVHSIAITIPEGADGSGINGSPYLGMNGALVYNRSTNGGQTFDKVFVLLPGVDSLNFNGFGGDAYAIDAKGRTVAIVAGDPNSKVTLWKSTDNGDTWTNTTVNPFPEEYIPWDSQITDLDDDGDVDSIAVEFDTTFTYVNDTIIVIDSSQTPPVSDTTFVTDTISEFIPTAWELEAVETTDGSYSVLIDNNDVVHVWFGRMLLSNDDTAGYTTYPSTNGLMYWNENFGADSLPVIIAGAIDDDSSGVVNVLSNFPGTNPTVFPYSGAGLSSFPSSGIDAEGTIYLSYVATKEGDDYRFAGDGPSLRHIYVIKSTDNGVTWTDPVDIVANTDVFDIAAEFAFPSIARKVDDNIHMIYQRDFTPGSAVSLDNTNLHEYGSNDIVYYSLSKGITDVSINKVEKNVLALTLVPNPANETVSLSFEVAVLGNLNVSISNILGQNVLDVVNSNALPGKQSLTINTGDLANGIYIVNVINGNQKSSKKLVVKH